MKNEARPLTKNAQFLRKNMTKEERRLWYDFLKKLPVTVNRQKAIGRYIVDFFCFSSRLVIEVDGAQHYTDGGSKADAERDAFLVSEGYKVLRYTNHDVNTDFEGVCVDILHSIGLTWDDLK